jgi:APA family basic amino acid/polyamine antiporter
MTTGSRHVSSELSRELSLFQLTMMGLGMMIGAGVFLGVGNSVYHAGPGGVLLTFALNGVIALFTAMSYAELSSAVPRAGGAYNFTRIGFGRGTSFLAGWMEWFASSVAGSMYALTFAIYAVRYFAVLGLELPAGLGSLGTKGTAAAVALLFLYINYRGASETGRVGAFFTLGQTLFLIVIGVHGIAVVSRDPSRLMNLEPFLPHGWTRLLVTMGFTYVAFEGFEVIAQAGDEAVNPRRNLPKAMLYSVYIVTLTYLLVAFATLVSVKEGSEGVVGAPWQWIGSFRERGFGEAISRLLPMGNLLLTLAVIFASTSALNATIYSATRASYALGRDRMMPGMLASVSKKRKTPWVALSFSGALILMVATLLPTMDVASSASIMFLFLFFMVNLCVIKVRMSMGDELRYGFLMPFFPILPVIAVVAQAMLAVWLVHMSVVAWIVAPAWVAAGVLVYRFYSRQRAVATEHDILVFEETRAPGGEEFQIMIPVANPGSALGLVRTTYKLCQAKRARVELLHMVPVPDQVPLHDADQYMLEGKEGIVEAMLYLESHFPVGTTVRYCRNIARGIVSAAKEKGVDMTVMGWRGPSWTGNFSLGSTLDPVIERSPSSVIVLRNCGNKTFRRVLVPLSGGPNGALALEVASILVEKDEAEIVAFTVAGPGASFNIDELVEKSLGTMAVRPEQVTTKGVRGKRVAAAILEEAKDYDLVVLGWTREPFMYRVARGSIPLRVAQLTDKPVVVVRASGGIRSLVRRWI